MRIRARASAFRLREPSLRLDPDAPVRLIGADGDCMELDLEKDNSFISEQRKKYNHLWWLKRGSVGC